MSDPFSFLGSTGYGNQIRGYPQAFDLLPTDAFVIDRLGVGTMFIEAQDLYLGGPYDVAMNYSSVPPPNTVFLTYIAARGFALVEDLVGSVAEFVTPPTSPMEVILSKNGVDFGAISFGAGNSGIGTFTGSAESFAVGDLLEITTPAATFGAANLAVTFLGSRTT